MSVKIGSSKGKKHRFFVSVVSDSQNRLSAIPIKYRVLCDDSVVKKNSCVLYFSQYADANLVYENIIGE